MEIQVSEEQGRVPVTVFHIIGEINAQNAGQLEAEATKAYDAGCRSLLLDLARVPYISSYGVRTISSIFNMFRAGVQIEDNAHLDRGLRDGSFKSSRLKLLNPTSQVLKVLNTAGVDMFLDIYNDRAKAIAAF